MKKETLHESITDAKRFLKAAEELERQNAHLCKVDPPVGRFQHFDIELAKFTAAVKRSSMDLTRSLAKLRQGK